VELLFRDRVGAPFGVGRLGIAATSLKPDAGRIDTGGTEGAMKTILVADDEDFLRLLVKETLDDYEVLEARDGEEALAMVRASLPELLILDWMMPGLDGPAVLERLRADASTQGLRVLMVTARCDEADRAKMIAAGASACLAKPFGTKELRERVEEVLSSGAVVSGSED
jgi:two-component system phosphate regulon response regulator PhoB